MSVCVTFYLLVFIFFLQNNIKIEKKLYSLNIQYMQRYDVDI